MPDFLTLAKSGPDLFDASVYQTLESAEAYHERVIDLQAKASHAAPTRFHSWLAALEERGTLSRIWTQNIDQLEDKLLTSADVVTASARHPRTVRLHGNVHEMLCHLNSSHCFPFDPELFKEPVLPQCPICIEQNERAKDVAKMKGRPPRRRSSYLVGALRPNIRLYNEHNEGQDISMFLRYDFRPRRSPDCLVIAGSRLKTHGARRLLGEMCQAAKARDPTCTVIYVNDEQHALGRLIDRAIDYRFRGDCQLFAARMLDAM